MRWARHIAGMEEKTIAYRLLIRKPEGKKPIGRPRRGWVSNILGGCYRDRRECCGLGCCD
jgi:hypothetical protein